MHQTALDEVNIRHFKLVSGDEILALVNTIEDNYCLVEQPLSLNVMHISEGKESYYFSEYMPLVKRDGPIILHMNSIVAHCEADDEFKEQYVRTCLKFRADPTVNEIDEGLEDDTEYDIEPTTKTYH